MNTQTAIITIAGRPNVGKSTLTNYLVGEKIAIVSNKPQTTRNRICGILTQDNTQYVFVDTPGFHKPRTKLGDYMVNTVRDSIADVDATILVVEPIPSIGAQEQTLIERIQATRCPAILAINKIDTVEKDKLLEVIAVYSQTGAVSAIIPISAKSGDGVGVLLEECEKYTVEGPSCSRMMSPPTSLSGRSWPRSFVKSCCGAWKRRSPTVLLWKSPPLPNGITALLTSMQPFTVKRPAIRALSLASKAPC